MINVFSRDQMIAYGMLPNEYYISILPTGGPKGVSIFQNESNVLTLVFDDVQQDSIKDKWPDGIGTFVAKAMTIEQATQLVDFINSIPKNSTINIHCVDGKSRSVAIKAAILGNKLDGNPWVYKLVKESYDNS